MTSIQNDASTRIYNQCLAGTPNNPGLPDALAKLVVGQSYNETNGWTSNFFINNNNCFGYECDSGSVYQDGCSSGNADNAVPVGNYASIEDSAKEVIDWIYRRKAEGKFPDLSTVTDATTYSNLLKSDGYFTSSASSYASRINDFLSQAGTLFTDAIAKSNPLLLLLILSALAGLIYWGIAKRSIKWPRTTA